MAITQEQIYAAADSIAAAGKNATVATVRTYLGTGSYSTITPILREWTEAQAAPIISVSPDETAPQQIVDILTATAPQVWATAAQKANEHLVIERSAMDIERTKMMAALTDSIATGEIIAADLETAHEQIADLTALVAHMKNDQTVQLALMHEAEIRTAVSEATATERAARIVDLQSVVEQLRADLK